jgi:hypothetical protein
MDPEDLQGRYQHLREQLDAAYAAPHWNSEQIDRIAEQMLPLERALATLDAPRRGESGAEARA